MSVPEGAESVVAARWRAAVLVGLPCLLAASPTRYDWSTADLGFFHDSPSVLAEAAPSRAICARVIGAEPPAADRPTPAEARALVGCDSEALFYGIRRPADPVAGRRCAILERGREVDGHASRYGYLPYFSGSGILAVAYANGRGAARHLDVATHMACGIADAVTATESRIASLQKLREAGSAARPFDICRDATSGASDGTCAAHDAQLSDQARDRQLAELERSWPAARRAAFSELVASVRAYAGLAHELDCYGGTAEVACAIRGAQADLTRFVAKVSALLGRGAPPPPPNRAGGGEAFNAATDAAAWKQQIDDAPAGDCQAYVANDPVNGTDPSGMCTGSLISGKDGQCAGGGFVQGAGSCSGNCATAAKVVFGETSGLKPRANPDDQTKTDPASEKQLDAARMAIAKISERNSATYSRDGSKSKNPLEKVQWYRAEDVTKRRDQASIPSNARFYFIRNRDVERYAPLSRRALGRAEYVGTFGRDAPFRNVVAAT